MRQMVVGTSSSLWVADPQAALILAGSWPSGQASVVVFRQQLRLHCFGSGPLVDDCVIHEFRPPVVVHSMQAQETLSADIVYTGFSSSTCTPSPFSRPCSADSFDADF